MKTAEAIERFLAKCRERGLSSETLRKYRRKLGSFAGYAKELPTDPGPLEGYLKRHSETPAHRGMNFKALQALYSYLEEFENIPSPVPGKGTIGRPRKYPDRAAAPPAPRLIPESETVEETGSQAKEGAGEKVLLTAEVVEQFTRSRINLGVSPRTLEGYRTVFKPFIRKFFHLPLITEEIEEYLGSLQVGAESKWTYCRIMRSLYHWLESRKRIAKELVNIPRIKVPRKVRRVLEEEDLRKLFGHTRNLQEEAILSLLIDSKVRASELCTLTREQVFPDHVIVEGKTGQRQVPIRPETYDKLIQLSSSGLLFRGPRAPLNRRTLHEKIHQICLRAGLDGAKLGPHILRHSASVQHIVHGGDILSLQEELGHTNPKQTALYAKLAYHQVSTIHDKVDVLGHITNHKALERGICRACQKEIVLEAEKAREIQCPGCHSVGMWYLPDYHPDGMKGKDPLPSQEAEEVSHA